MALTCLFLAPTERVYAIAGVLDSVVIVNDATDLWKWPRELDQWQMLIGYARAEVERTEELIHRSDEVSRRVGNPGNSASVLVGSVPDLMVPIDEAVSLETTKHALESSKNLFGLGSRTVKNFRDGRKVDRTYEAFGETFDRQERRYTHFAMQEAMLARCRTAATNEELVVRKETELQHDTLGKLKRANSIAEISVLNAIVAASQQRQALAHQKTLQAIADTDTFRGRLALEEARKAEGDREWAQAVIDRMKEKALAAYNAQAGGSSSGY